MQKRKLRVRSSSQILSEEVQFLNEGCNDAPSLKLFISVIHSVRDVSGALKLTVTHELILHSSYGVAINPKVK